MPAHCQAAADCVRPGDIDSCALKALLEQQLGSWVVGPSQPKQAPSVPSTPLPEFIPGADTVFLVDRPGLTQVQVLDSRPHEYSAAVLMQLVLHRINDAV